jgi:uncharacterized protein
MSVLQAPSPSRAYAPERPAPDGVRRRQGRPDIPKSDPRDTTTGSLERAGPVPVKEFTLEECRILLGLTTVGRVAFLADDYPVVLPVNYRLVNDDAGIMVLVRTRPGHSIDRAPLHVAFEIDGIDDQRHQGWSVLVRGRLHHLDEDVAGRIASLFEPDPWPHEHSTSWLVIAAEAVSGRMLESAEAEWPFSACAYL